MTLPIQRDDHGVAAVRRVTYVEQRESMAARAAPAGPIARVEVIA